MNIKGQNCQQKFGILNPGHVFSTGDRVWMKMDNFTVGTDKFNVVALDRYEIMHLNSEIMITYRAKASVHLDE